MAHQHQELIDALDQLLCLHVEREGEVRVAAELGLHGFDPLGADAAHHHHPEAGQQHGAEDDQGDGAGGHAARAAPRRRRANRGVWGRGSRGQGRLHPGCVRILSRAPGAQRIHCS